MIACDIESVTICLCMQMFAHVQSAWLDRRGEGRGERVNNFSYLKSPNLSFMLGINLIDLTELSRSSERRKGEENKNRRLKREERGKREGKAVYLGENHCLRENRRGGHMSRNSYAPTCERQYITDLLRVINMTICLISD